MALVAPGLPGISHENHHYGTTVIMRSSLTGPRASRTNDTVHTPTRLPDNRRLNTAIMFIDAISGGIWREQGRLQRVAWRALPTGKRKRQALIIGISRRWCRNYYYCVSWCVCCKAVWRAWGKKGKGVGFVCLSPLPRTAAHFRYQALIANHRGFCFSCGENGCFARSGVRLRAIGIQ